MSLVKRQRCYGNYQQTNLTAPSEPWSPRPAEFLVSVRQRGHPVVLIEALHCEPGGSGCESWPCHILLVRVGLSLNLSTPQIPYGQVLRKAAMSHVLYEVSEISTALLQSWPTTPDSYYPHSLIFQSSGPHGTKEERMETPSLRNMISEALKTF